MYVVTQVICVLTFDFTDQEVVIRVCQCVTLENGMDSAASPLRMVQIPGLCQWLCATAYHGLAVSYRLPLVSGNYAPASSGPFSAARTGCGDVRAVLESSEVPLSGS